VISSEFITEKMMQKTEEKHQMELATVRPMK
jgi:hypothetical protein